MNPFSAQQAEALHREEGPERRERLEKMRVQRFMAEQLPEVG